MSFHECSKNAKRNCRALFLFKASCYNTRYYDVISIGYILISIVLKKKGEVEMLKIIQLKKIIQNIPIFYVERIKNNAYSAIKALMIFLSIQTARTIIVSTVQTLIVMKFFSDFDILHPAMVRCPECRKYRTQWSFL